MKILHIHTVKKIDMEIYKIINTYRKINYPRWICIICKAELRRGRKKCSASLIPAKTCTSLRPSLCSEVIKDGMKKLAVSEGYQMRSAMQLYPFLRRK